MIHLRVGLLQDLFSCRVWRLSNLLSYWSIRATLWRFHQQQCNSEANDLQMEVILKYLCLDQSPANVLRDAPRKAVLGAVTEESAAELCRLMIEGALLALEVLQFNSDWGTRFHKGYLLIVTCKCHRSRTVKRSEEYRCCMKFVLEVRAWNEAHLWGLGVLQELVGIGHMKCREQSISSAKICLCKIEPLWKHPCDEWKCEVLQWSCVESGLTPGCDVTMFGKS